MTTRTKDMKALAKALKRALKPKGFDIPHVTLLQALASAGGETNWQVLKARGTPPRDRDGLRIALEDTLQWLRQDGAIDGVHFDAASVEASIVAALAGGAPPPDPTPVVFQGDPPLTPERLKALETTGTIAVIVEVDLNDLIDFDLEALLDHLSERVTGSLCGLSDIAYAVAPRTAGLGRAQDVLIRVEAAEIVWETLPEPKDPASGENPSNDCVFCFGSGERKGEDCAHCGGTGEGPERVRDAYENGECPECGTAIAPDHADGQGCSGCGHVLGHYRPVDDPAGLSATAPTPADAEPAVPARAYTDDRKVEASFDARRWLVRATDRQIRELLDCGGGDYPADDVARERASAADAPADLEKLFAYLEIVNRPPIREAVGFECYVDEEALRAWVRTHRPHLLERA